MILADKIMALRKKAGWSQEELAARLNIGRASLYRELQKLEERGALVRKGKRILVRDPDALDAEHRIDVDPTTLP